MKIPFEWLPGSWGLRGKTKQIAKAEYELSGHELEVKLASINHSDDTEEYARAKIESDFKYKKIDQYEYDLRTANLGKTENDIVIAKLDVELKHGRITSQEHERQKADILGEPWMAMPKISWDPINTSKTYFELDYNDHFVKSLRDNGYSGSDDDCIGRWLNDVCSSIVDEMSQADPEFVTSVRRLRRDDGKVEHS